MPAEFASGIDRVYVKCPAPGQENQAAQTIGELRKTEHGQKHLAVPLATLDKLAELGVVGDEALIMAFAGAVVTNAEGAVVMAPQETAESVSEPVPVEPVADKKKLTLTQTLRPQTA